MRGASWRAGCTYNGKFYHMLGEFLRKVTAALDNTGVPYMLTGSLASSMYGIPRATNDIDIVVARHASNYFRRISSLSGWPSTLKSMP